MNRGLSLTGVGHATSLFFGLTFVLCVAFDLVFPERRMYESWQALLPGFTWISWGSFFLGLLESYGYGWSFALIWVPLYNVFASRGARPSSRPSARKAA